MKLSAHVFKLRNRVMRTAWELHRVSGLTFGECLKKAWQIVKDSFAKIKLVYSKPVNYWESLIVEKTAKEVNREFIANIVWYVEHFKKTIAHTKKEEARKEWENKIRAEYSPIEADHIIYKTSLD